MANILSTLYNTLARHKFKCLLGILALVLWFGLIVLSQWWLGQQDVSQYEGAFVHFDGEPLKQSQLINDAGDISVVHFVDPSCPCSRFSRPHIASLEKEYSNGVRHYYWPNLPAAMKHQVDISAVTITPAVAIWSAKGELSYFGPHSSGAFCGVGEDFVALMLKQLLDHKTASWIQHDVMGCYCQTSASL